MVVFILLDSKRLFLAYIPHQYLVKILPRKTLRLSRTWAANKLNGIVRLIFEADFIGVF